MENLCHQDKTHGELLQELNTLKNEYEMLKTAYNASISKCNILSVNLKERIKELGAIYRLGNLLDDPNITLEGIMQEVAGFLPLSWQYPECSCARVVYQNLEYTSADYKESDWKMSKPIVVNNAIVGRIEVNYTEQKPYEYEGPFLEEEYLLLEVISERIGKIIQRFETEKELRFSEEKFAASFMASPAAMSINDLDDDNRFLDVNQSFQEITGYQRTEIIGHTPDDLNLVENPKDRAMLNEQFKSQQKIQNKEYTFRKKNGETGYGLVNVEFFRIHGKSYAITATNEITDAKRTKINLEKSQLLLDTIINSTNDLIYAVDSEIFGLLSYNKSYQDFYLRVYNLQVKTGMRPEDMGQPEHLTEIWRRLYQRALLEDHFTIEHHLEDLNIFTYLTFNLLKRNGTVFGISVFSKDITERKRAEISLKEEYNFRIAVENSMQAGIAAVDITGKQIIVNNYFSKMVGWTPEELLGKHAPFAYWAPNEMSNLSNAFQQTLNGFAPTTGFELKFRKKNGELFDVLINLSALKNAQDEIIGWLSIVTDISNLKRAELDLIIAKEKAEESDRLKTSFLLNLSHEIRTPMSCIIGFSDLLKRPSLTGDQQHQYIELISKGCDRMLNIINELVDISKIEAGIVDINLKDINIVDQIRFVYDSFKPEAEQKGLNFIFNENNGLKNPVIHSDEEKVYSIISSLIENAIKYTPSGTVEIGYVSKNNHIEVYVKDTGIGIPKDRQVAIFERFVQADIENIEAFQGAGLGLSIAKSFVEMLGGKIRVESQVGVGSTFTFLIPWNNLHETDTPELSKNERSEKMPGSKKLKILITEDDIDIATIIEKTIQDLSFEILFAGTGEKAVEICANHPDVDLIIMDINLPGIDGVLATQKIREFNSKVIIIAQTAYTQKVDREKVLAAGCNDYISKPFRINELHRMVAKYCVLGSKQE